MLLLKKELVLCLHARGYRDIPSFTDVKPEMSQQEQEGIRERLIGRKLLEKTDSGETGYRFSALGQVILDTVGAPEVWLELINERAGIHRRLYLRDAFYICVEEDRQFLRVDLLPSLPLMIGGYASALKGLQCTEQLKDEQLQAAWENAAPFIRVFAHCGDEELRLEIGDNGIARKTAAGETVFAQFSEESCTNSITMWLLKGLKERGGKNGE